MAEVIRPQERELKGWGYMAYRGTPREPFPADAIMAGYKHYHSLRDPVDIGDLVVSEAELRAYVARNNSMPRRVCHSDYIGSYVYVHRVEWDPREIIAWTEERDMGDVTA